MVCSTSIYKESLTLLLKRSNFSHQLASLQMQSEGDSERGVNQEWDKTQDTEIIPRCVALQSVRPAELGALWQKTCAKGFIAYLMVTNYGHTGMRVRYEAHASSMLPTADTTSGNVESMHESSCVDNWADLEDIAFHMSPTCSAYDTSISTQTRLLWTNDYGNRGSVIIANLRQACMHETFRIAGRYTRPYNHSFCHDPTVYLYILWVQDTRLHLRHVIAVSRKAVRERISTPVTPHSNVSVVTPNELHRDIFFEQYVQTSFGTL